MVLMKVNRETRAKKYRNGFPVWKTSRVGIWVEVEKDFKRKAR